MQRPFNTGQSPTACPWQAPSVSRKHVRALTVDGNANQIHAIQIGGTHPVRV